MVLFEGNEGKAVPSGGRGQSPGASRCGVDCTKTLVLPGAPFSLVEEAMAACTSCSFSLRAAPRPSSAVRTLPTPGIPLDYEGYGMRSNQDLRPASTRLKSRSLPPKCSWPRSRPASTLRDTFK